MPASTPNRGLPYPIGADPIDVAGDIRRLAEAIDALTSGGVIGEIKLYGGITAPPNTLFARGQAVLRADWPELFAVYGTRFGAGDGTTTFNMPDIRGVYPFGHNEGGAYGQVGVGQKFGAKDAVLPSHNHSGAAHLHVLGGSVSAQPQRHEHNVNMGEVVRLSPLPTTSIGALATGPHKTDTMAPGGILSGSENETHTHPLPANTGGADRSLTTGTAGVSATNGNLPPSLSLNFIVVGR